MYFGCTDSNGKYPMAYASRWAWLEADLLLQMATTELTKKVIVIGDSGVGKTAFVARVSENRFISEYKATIGGRYIQVSIENSSVSCLQLTVLLRSSKKEIPL